MQRSKVSGPGLPVRRDPGARLPLRKKKTGRNLRESLGELWTERPKLAVAIGVLLCISFIALLPGPAEDQPNIVFQFGLRQIRNFGQSKALRQIAFFVGGAKAAASYEEAKSYHESRMSFINEHIDELQLHWYWAEMAKTIDTADITWYDIIEKRMATMARLLQEQGRDDFRVEKDKCEMMRFFMGNELPVVPPIEIYDSTAAVVHALRSGELFVKITKWPIWIKACHLTQGSAKATRMLKSEQWIRDNIDELEDWIHAKWVYRADDWQRPWRENGNMLTDTLIPGFMIQSSANLSHNPETGKDQIVELKVEVLWGQPYLAVSPDMPGLPGSIFTRTAGVGEVMVFDGKLNLALMMGESLPADSWWHWIIKDKHLDCVWDLAERSALLMGIECVRIDIFITHGKPNGCVINEDSISSGMNYGPHFEFLTKAWALPHLSKRYNVYNSTRPVYMQTEKDVPGLAPKLKGAKPAYRSHVNVLGRHR